MQIVDYPNKIPGICFLCEQTNPGRYIDLMRDFETGVVTRLTGRKYVCEGCVQGLADTFGWIHPDHYWELNQVLDNTNEQNTELRAEIEKLQVLLDEEYSQVLRDLFGKKTNNKQAKAKVGGKK